MAARRAARTQMSSGDGTILDDAELARIFQEAVRQAVAAHLAAGRPVHYGGEGSAAGRLYMRLPDGRRVEYTLRTDGTPEILREVGV